MPAWHYAQNNQPAGPVDDATIRRLIAGGQVQRRTLVWRDGLPEWVTAEKAGLFRGPPPAPVPAHTEVGQILAACRAALGPAPRKLGNSAYLQFAPPAWMPKQPKDPLWEIYRNQQRLYSHGVVVWGHIVQANSLLFAKGPGDCPACGMRE